MRAKVEVLPIIDHLCRDLLLTCFIRAHLRALGMQGTLCIHLFTPPIVVSINSIARNTKA